MAQMETLLLETGRGPALIVREPVYQSIKCIPDHPFEITLETVDFSAQRWLAVADLIQIRDWCNEAIEAAQAMKVAAE